MTSLQFENLSFVWSEEGIISISELLDLLIYFCGLKGIYCLFLS
jgi:hypothetical protein